VDGVVLQTAGRNTPFLIDGGLSLVQNHRLGAAQLFLAAARDARLAGSEKLSEAISGLADKEPALKISGSAESGRLGALLTFGQVTPESNAGKLTPGATALTEFIVRSDNRTKALELLEASPNPLVQALMHFRSVTNTVLFPPASSASGQALDAAVSICDY